jgi:hypothetical protein
MYLERCNHGFVTNLHFMNGIAFEEAFACPCDSQALYDFTNMFIFEELDNPALHTYKRIATNTCFVTDMFAYLLVLSCMIICNYTLAHTWDSLGDFITHTCFLIHVLGLGVEVIACAQDEP